MADPVTSQTNLVELCSPVIKQLADITREGAVVNAIDLRTRFEDIFRDFEMRGQRQGVPLSDVQQAKYALVALVDETILLSELPAREDWLGRPLQMQFFDDFSAGEEFYNRLDALRASKAPGAVDVLEVFHLCLALGFRGKYGDARGAERRRVLVDGCGQEINGARGTRAGALSPHAESPEQQIAPARSLSWIGRAPVWAVPLAAVAIVLLAALTLSLITGYAIGGLSQAVQEAEL